MGIMLEGHSVLLTGQAGSGKTYVLNAFIKHAKKSGKKVAVTATTGLAATHVGGNTIHSWSGMGIHSTLPKNFFKDMPKGRIDNIKKADVLIIDEISMLHDYRLDMVNQIAKSVRDDVRPFGGLQVILCGDFFQLPPVSRDDQEEGGFVVDSAAWEELSPLVCYLSEQHRQEDSVYLDILTALRGNDLRQRHAKMLLERVNNTLNYDSPITELHTTNVDVDAINNRQLAALPGETFSYNMQSTGKEIYVNQLKRSCLAHEVLQLKKGALVMCIKNNPEKKYVNGSLGVIESFEPLTDYPVVRLLSGRVVTLTPESWELRDGDKKRAGLIQIPLRLAWAITIHKSQGMTLDAATIDLRRAFVEGMGYVALSRVKSLNNLNLLGFNRMALKVSPRALQIEQHLQERSAEACEKYQHLAVKDEKLDKKSKKAKKSATTSRYTQTLEELRKTYPKTYTKWATDDDELLKELFNKNIGLKEMVPILQRQPNGIRARIRKHFGDGVVIKP